MTAARERENRSTRKTPKRERECFPPRSLAQMGRWYYVAATLWSAARDVAPQPRHHPGVHGGRIRPLWRFDHLGDRGKARVVHHVAESGLAERSFADHLVPVAPGVERRLRIVEMHALQASHPDDIVEVLPN